MEIQKKYRMLLRSVRDLQDINELTQVINCVLLLVNQMERFYTLNIIGKGVRGQHYFIIMVHTGILGNLLPESIVDTITIGRVT